MTDAQRRTAARWQSEARGRLRSALINDALDALGLRDQFLSAGFVPLEHGTRLVGLAFTVQIELVDEVPETPYIGLLASLDAVGPDQVYVAAVDGAARGAVWGELITVATRARGAVGALVDAYTRDSEFVRAAGFPVFSRGRVPADSNGRSEVRTHGVPVVIDGVRIEPGDLIVADDDGVAIVPAAHITEVVDRALEKDSQESEFRTAVAAGMNATDAFYKYGVL